MRLALLALLTLSAPARAATPSALPAAADAFAREMGPPAEGRRTVLLVVETRAVALRAPVETALDAALSARGYAVTPDRTGGDPESRARASGQEWLLRVQAGVVPGQRDLALMGELIPAWRSFFLQRHPDARALPPRIVQARAPADPETLLLGRESGPARLPFAKIRRLARVPGRVLALAIGEPREPGHVAIVVATAEALLMLSPSGERLAMRSLAGGELASPVRDPAAALAIGDYGGGRIAMFRAGAARGEVLAVRGNALEPSGVLEAAPLCAGGAGRLFGAFEARTGVFRDVLATSVDPDAPPRSGRTLYGAACAPRAGPIAVAALGTDLHLELLGADLQPVRGSDVPAAQSSGATSSALTSGCGFALADLDGDGTAELVTSSADPSVPERIRIFAPLAEAPLLFESRPIPGTILSGAGGDVTGDGIDDAVLGAVVVGRDGVETTDLLLVTSDARVAP